MFDEVSRRYRGSLDHTLRNTGGDSELSFYMIHIYIHERLFCIYVYIEIKGLPRWLYW